jgi:general secretion pathway protein F
VTVFAYEAARTDGAVIRGTVEATSAPDAAALLSIRGLLPIAVETRTERPAIFGRPSARALATIFQSLASLVDAGVPLHKALAATRALASPRLGEALARVETRVREGASLATALASEPRVFPPVTVGLLRAGDRGMGLGPALAQAARQLEREAESRARIQAALAYPLILAVVGTASVALIVLFVIPRFAALLGDLGQALPPATRLLLGMSATIREYGLPIVALLAAGVIVASHLIVARRAAWHAWLLHLPVIGPLRHALASARAARTLGALLASGTPALAAVETAGEAAGDAAVAARLAAARVRVAQGAGLTAALDAARALTPATLQLSAIGEGAGKLPSLLARAAELEEDAAERRLKLLATLLEPALIVTFAGIVAFVAAALLQAVYALRPGGA